jgi:hypothetical protein
VRRARLASVAGQRYRARSDGGQNPGFRLPKPFDNSAAGTTLRNRRIDYAGMVYRARVSTVVLQKFAKLTDTEPHPRS